MILSMSYAFTEGFRLEVELPLEVINGEVHFEQLPMQFVTMSTSQSKSARNRKPRQMFMICRGNNTAVPYSNSNQSIEIP